MDDLTQNWSCMYLSHRESHGCSLTKKADSISQSIVANILTKKKLQMWTSSLGLLIHYGGLAMVFKFKILETTSCCSLLTTKPTWIVFLQANHGVLISTQQLCQDTSKNQSLKKSLLIKLVFGSNCLVYHYATRLWKW